MRPSCFPGATKSGTFTDAGQSPSRDLCRHRVFNRPSSNRSPRMLVAQRLIPPPPICLLKPIFMPSGAPGASSLRRKSSPDLNSRVGRKLVYGSDGDLIAELTKGSRQHLGTLLLFPGTDFVALLDKSHPFMQDLPNDA